MQAHARTPEPGQGADHAVGKAGEEFERATGLTRNERERALFLARATATGG
ncbi:hypothetical protein GCM10018952_04240 [Streptosporangium vulgare]